MSYGLDGARVAKGKEAPGRVRAGDNKMIGIG